MKQPSNRTRKLITELQALPVEGRDLFGRQKQDSVKPAVELINGIAQSGEWASVIYLVPYVVAPEQAIAESAAHGIEALLKNIRPSLLLQLDDRLRGGLWSVPVYLNRWDAMNVTDLYKHLSENLQVGVTGIASFHRNGYVREAATMRLAGGNDGDELPFLLIRLSDWVPQVRSVAEDAVEQRITPEYLPHFVDSVVLLEGVPPCLIHSKRH